MECESESANVSPIRIGDIDIIGNIGNIGNIEDIENYCKRERCVTLYGRSASILPVRKKAIIHKVL